MKNSFENQWKDALGDASHTPPPEIWDRVEIELEKKKKAGFLIWKNPFLLSGVAAALILVLATLFLFDTSTNIEAVSKSEPVNASATHSDKSFGEEIKNETSKEQYKKAVNANKNVNKTKKEEIFNFGDSRKTALASSNLDVSNQDAKDVTLTRVTPKREPLLDDVYGKKNALNFDKKTALAEALTPAGTSSEKESIPLFSEAKTTFEKLKTSQVVALNNSFQKPVQKIDIALLEDKGSAQKEKNGWFGVLASNAPFNPNFSTPGLQQQAEAAIMNSDNTFKLQSGMVGGGDAGSTGSYTNTNRRDAQSNFRLGSALSYGVGFGKRLKKRLAIESGVRFTTAQTSHVYNVYSVDKTTGGFNSFSLANYALPDNLKNSDVLISVNGSSQITYNFLSIPILLNYNLLNLGRFNVNAVGGLSSEILLSGNVAHPKDVNQSFNAGNSNFKAFNVAGLGGVRLSYALTRQLDVNLGSTYQHFLNSGIEGSTNASFRPSMLGVNMGISVRR